MNAYHKEFSLTTNANYPKGHKNIFQDYVKQNHPGVFYFHLEHLILPQQYIVYMGSLAIYWNHK